jgi:glycosyltransferase involved in cell wall biosynthesis
MSRLPLSEPTDIAAINFFPAFTPPRSGGEMRYFHLYSRLARLGFRVRMVNPTYPFVEPETVRHNDLCTEVRVPQTALHHRLYQFMQRALRQGECSANVVALATPFHREFLRQAREAIASSRIVMFDYPFPLGPFLKGLHGARPLIVHNSYNVEGVMQRRTLRGWQGRLLAAWTSRVQRAMCRRADVVFACSREDAMEMTRLYGLDPTKIYIVPNGVDSSEIAPVNLKDETQIAAARRSLGIAADGPCALFLGSHHAPNIEAARFLMERAAPDCPEVRFLIAGSVCPHLPVSAPANVTLVGKFDDEQKRALFQAATFAVNPMFSGSGTNLKMLEFFAAGLPVLSTPHGARGLMTVGQETSHVRVADARDFAAQVRELASSPEARHSLARAAREIACNRYDWDRIAEDTAEILHHKTHRHILVLNDYPITPVTFGGQARILNHYRSVAKEANVTILTQTRGSAYRRHAPAPGIEEISIPDSPLTTLAKKALFTLTGIECDDVAAHLTARYTGAFRDAFRREARFARILTLAHPYLVSLARGAGNARVVHESHNVEASLKAQLYGKGFWQRWTLKQVMKCEREAVRRADLVTVCSEDDERDLRDLYLRDVRDAPRIILTTNGVDCGAHERDCAGMDRAALRRVAGLGNEPMAIFLGSGHHPNTVAARFIIEELVPRHPQVLFAIVGGVCWAVRRAACPPNLLLFFEREEKIKNRLLAMSDVALNPLTTGSGVSLKTLDCLAAGTAILSTEVGARGVAVESGVHGVLCPPERFSEELAGLVGNMDRCHAMGEKARQLALEKYDWSVTSRPFIETVRDWL